MSSLWRKVKELVVGKKVTKYYNVYDVTSLEIIDSDVLDDTRKRLILKYVKTGYGSRNYILDYGNTGAAQFFQYYLSGKRNYTDALPLVTVGGVGVPIAAIQDILIASEKTTGITIISVYSRTIDNATWIKSELCRRYNYDINTNRLSIGSKIYAFYPDDSAGQSVFTNVVLRYVSGSPAGNTIISVPMSDSHAKYYQVVYTVPSKGLTKIFAYCPYSSVSKPITYSTITIDEVEGSAKQVIDGFNMYPIAMLRNEFWNLNDWNSNSSPGSTGSKPSTVTEKRYNETKKLLSELGVDVDTILEEVSADSQISKVKDMCFLLGISPANHSPVISKIMWKLFETVYNFFRTDDYRFWGKYSVLSEEMKIRSNTDYDHLFNTLIEWIPRKTTTSTGVIGPVGSYRHTIRDEKIANISYDEEEFQGSVSLTFTYSSTGVGAGQDNYWEIRESSSTAVRMVGYNDDYTIPVLYNIDQSFSSSSGGSAWHNKYTRWQVSPIEGLVEVTYDRQVQRPDGTIMPYGSTELVPKGYIEDTTGGFNDGRWYYAIPTGVMYQTKNIQAYKNWLDSIAVSGSWFSTFGNTTPVVNPGTYTHSMTLIKKPYVGSRSTISNMIIQRQDTANTYSTMYIDDLFAQTYITSAAGSVVNQYLKKDGKENKDFIIPISIEILQTLSFMERTELLSHSLYLNFYISHSYSVTTYEGGFLKPLMTILAVVISIVIAVLTGGSGAVLSGSIAGFFASLGASILVANVLAGLLIGMALSIVLKLIIKVAGNSFLGQILSAIAIVAAIYLGGGFDGALDSGFKTLKLATQLVEIPSTIINMDTAGKMEALQEDFQNLQEEASEFDKMYQERYESNQDILDQFNTGEAITGGFMVSLNYSSEMVGKTFSPSVFFEGAIGSMFNFDYLYDSGIDSSYNRMLEIGSV